MKAKISTMTIMVTVVLFITFHSCKKEKENFQKPMITMNELGYNNSKIGYLGSDLHVEADIVAEGNIDKIMLEIHPEGSGSFEYSITYTEFSGLKNTVFHKHVDMPINISDTGNYHFHLRVTDMSGNETMYEDDLRILKPEDSIAPVISITSAPADMQVFSNGQTISIAGSVTDEKALGGLYIGLVRTDQALADADVNNGNTITLLHTHSFSNPVSYSFSANINVGAANDNDITPKPVSWSPGNYYLLVKCKDAFGGNWSFSVHYPLVIN